MECSTSRRMVLTSSLQPGKRQFTAALCCLLLLFLQVSSARSCTSGDRAALLSFKQGTERDTVGLLANWVKGGDCCSFKGVTCNSKGRVVNLTIEVPPVAPDCDSGQGDICPNLQRIQSKANLIGKTLSKLSALEVLSLVRFDTLQDVTPTGLSALKNLRILKLESASFQGPVSQDIGKITSLQYLSLRGSPLDGPLPAKLCGLVNLKTLDLTTGFTNFFGPLNGPLLSCIGNLKKLQYLYSEYGHLSGPVPASFAQLKKLKEVKLSGNELSGFLPVLSAARGLTVLNLDGNPFVGSVPPSYGTLSKLVELRLGGLNVSGEAAHQFTQLTGTLPQALGKLIKLKVLVIRATQIAGPIPASYGKLINLVDLELDHNQLTGPVPNLSRLKKLVTLNLEGNHFDQ